MIRKAPGGGSAPVGQSPAAPAASLTAAAMTMLLALVTSVQALATFSVLAEMAKEAPANE